MSMELLERLTLAEQQLLYRLRQLCNEQDETAVLLQLRNREEIRLQVLDRLEQLGGDLTKEN